MEQAISTFCTFPQNPKERTSFVEKCVDEITSGERNPLEFEVMLKNLEDTISLVRKNEKVKNAIADEVGKYAEKTFSYSSYEITKCEGKKALDFSNDSVWVELNDKLKAREKLLKSVNHSFDDIVDGKTGEILKPPIIKYSKPYIIIKYKEY